MECKQNSFPKCFSFRNAPEVFMVCKTFSKYTKKVGGDLYSLQLSFGGIYTH
jgi:hypothetical protein